MSCIHVENGHNITKSLQGRMIYKDECSRCYVNQDDDQGVNVCMVCFKGGCEDHSRQHYKQKDHPIVLKITRKIVQKDVPEESKKITKLAIGKEGGADFTGEEYEITAKPYCLACEKELDPTPIQDAVNQLKNAESASLKSGISAWEQEVKPCPHTQTLVQHTDAVLGDKAMAHCAKCTISTNLWLCLMCGSLACGRKQPDGTGGNGHALEHYKDTGHACNVKLGTITPNGNASVYCYGCDDDVIDEHLSAHLKHFGLDINIMEKTEKTMAELNLLANLNLTLSSVLERGRKLPPVFGEGLTGMQNLGNTCYMNSVLQAILAIDEFKDRYAKEGLDHLSKCDRFPPECFQCQFSKVANGIWSGKHSVMKEAKNEMVEGPNGELFEKEMEAYQDGIRPFMFKLLVGKGHPEFSTDKQQDAAEYLRHLFTIIQKSEKQEKKSDITKNFRFKQVTKLSCMTCGGYKLRENDSEGLALPLPKQNIVPKESDQSQGQMLKDASKTVETLDKDNKVEVNKEAQAEENVPQVPFKSLVDTYKTEVISMNCPKCGGNKDFKKTHYIKHWPKYLIIEINRIVFDDWVIKKDPSEIIFPSDSLDLSTFVLPPPGQNEVLLQDDDEQDAGPQFDQPSLDQLLMMGFGENRAKRALLSNNSNVELATNWLFEKMDDPSLDDPLPKQKKASAGGAVQVSQESIDMITCMGFSAKQARIALSKTDSNAERAVDFLFNHPEIDDNYEEEGSAPAQKEEIEVEDPAKPVYELNASVIHLGRSYFSGHYVCYVKKDGKWVYFNDSKVASDDDPAIGRGMLFILKQSTN